MKNLFRAFGSQSNATSNEENVAFDLDEQDLEAVTGAGGGGDYCYDDDDDCHDYDDDDDYHRHHHHHHHHHHC